MKLVFAILGGAFAAYLFHRGSVSGGWAQELGEVYYCYAFYVASDAIGDLLKALAGK